MMNPNVSKLLNSLSGIHEESLLSGIRRCPRTFVESVYPPPLGALDLCTLERLGRGRPERGVLWLSKLLISIPSEMAVNLRTELLNND